MFDVSSISYHIMKHPEQIEKYDGSLPLLAEDLGNLRYDALANFLRALSDKIQTDGTKDQDRGRPQLASSLFDCAESIQQAAQAIDKAWQISAPYMDK